MQEVEKLQKNFSNRNHMQLSVQAAFTTLDFILNVIEESFHPHLIALNNAIILSFSEAYFFLWIVITSSPFLVSLGVLEKLRARANLTSVSTCETKLLENSESFTK